jgi:UDP-N-acetylglucosamine 1-carboxyvinyltransferase
MLKEGKMEKFIIEGGYQLQGEIETSGCKNAALPIMAAALLTSEPSTITNIPNISDVYTLSEIINKLGGEAEQIDKNTWKIFGKNINTTQLDPILARRLRASILLLGPVIALKKEALFPHPGGCVIGQRPVDTHFEALRALGVDITADQENYVAKAEHLTGNKMFLDEVSVGATENALTLAALTPGETLIRPAACEPHVRDLANFLKAAGARIQGEGTHEIKITGVQQLNGVENYSIIPDNIEAGTFAIAAVATGGQVKIKNIIPEDMDPIVHKLNQMGANITVGSNYLEVKPAEELKSARIQVDTWPRLPSDIQAPFAVLATKAKGTSLIHEWLFERRLGYIEDLSRMGAKIVLCDPHRALINGPSKLRATKIKSPDIRAGIALLIAALIAKGRSEIEQIELIDRGYENLENKLKNLGAKIERVKIKEEIIA